MIVYKGYDWECEGRGTHLARVNSVDVRHCPGKRDSVAAVGADDRFKQFKFI